MNTLKKSDLAPLFSLVNQDGQVVHLGDYIGKSKVLVYFYPKASTPGCTMQAQGLRDHKSALDQENLVVFGISPDAPSKLLNFKTKQALNFDLLADEDHQVAEAFGAWGPKKVGKDIKDGIHRYSFIIGLDGKIEAVLTKFKTKDHHQAVVEALNPVLPSSPFNDLTIGSDVPKFILPDQHQQLHNIEDVIGKKRIIIYFYPQAATPGCTVQAQGLRDIKNQLDQQNVAVFGISPDKPAKLLKFAEKEQLNFTLLSDVDHQVAEQFGIWGLKQFMGRQFDGIHRITFVIGLDGKIEQILNKFKTKDHHQVVLENL